MAKKKKSKTVSVRPKTSPYTSSPITVYIGVNRQRYYVHNDLLQKFENLPPRSPWVSEMALGDLDADIGHILIHFLHTGAYQTLDKTDDENLEVDETDVAINEFQKAVRASEAATRYGLPGLQQLAQAEMERWGADMNLRDTVRAIGEDSIAKSFDESTWLRDYVSQQVDIAFELTPEIFSEPDFFEQISNHTLTKILAQNLVSLYSKKVLDLQKEQPADETPFRFGKHGHTATWFKWPNPHGSRMDSCRPTPEAGTQPEPVGKVEVLDDSSAAREPHILDGGQPSTPDADASELPQKSVDHAEDATRVEARDSTLADTIPVSEQPEAGTTVLVSNDAGIEETKVEEEMHPISQDLVLDPSTEPPADESIPSASAVEDIMVVEEAAERLEPASEEADHLRTPKEQTAARNTVEETCAMEPAESFHDIVEDRAEKTEEGLGWSDWRPISTTSKKKKKKKKGVECVFDDHVPTTTEAEPEPPLPELVPECATELPPPEVAPEPVLTVEPPFAEKEENSWGEERSICKKMKKKAKKAKRKDMYDEAPPPEPEAAPGSDLIEPIAIVEDVQDAGSKVQTTTILGSDVCSRRLGHLFEGDGWRTCKLCQADMRQMASKLHMAGLSNANGFGVAV